MNHICWLRNTISETPVVAYLIKNENKQIDIVDSGLLNEKLCPRAFPQIFFDKDGTTYIFSKNHAKEVLYGRRNKFGDKKIRHDKLRLLILARVMRVETSQELITSPRSNQLLSGKVLKEKYIN